MRSEKQLQVPLSAVTGLIEKLKPSDWLLLRQWLDEKLAEREDELMLKNPRIMREIRESQAEYKAGNYVSAKALRTSLGKKSRRNV